MTTVLVFGAMALIAVAIMVWPFLRRSDTAVNTRDGAMAVLRDQIHEVERDRARKVISAAEADDAIIEIKRRLLLVSKRAQSPQSTASGGAWLAALSVVIVGVTGVGLYTVLGNPNVPSMPYAERAAERESSAEMLALTTELRGRLDADPEGGPFDGWMILGQSLMGMNLFTDAAEAFSVASERPEATSSTFSRLAEALIAAENGVVTPPAEAAIEEAIDRDPLNPAALYYQAIALGQAGRNATAYDLLADRIRRESEIQPWMSAFTDQLNRLGEQMGRPPVGPMMLLAQSGPGPTAEDVAAASEMSAEDRAAFIRSMVDRLATRLEETPDDLDGWLRLANAYSVLGERDQAREALDRAEPLLPDAGPQRQTFDQLQQALQE